MQASKPSLFALAAIAAASVLTACGGGSGGNDPVEMSSVANGSASKDLTVKAGDVFSFSVTANSPDNALSNLRWTMQASANAPTLALTNMDCAVAEKTDTPRQNGLVASVWKCTISGTTPGLVEKDSVYTFTAVATNTKGSTNSTSSVLNVTATPSDDRTPRVEIDGPTKAAGGQVKDFSCNAANRFATSGQTPVYTYAWSSSVFEGQQVAFDSRSTQKVKATFPQLPSKATMIVTCKATDGAGNVGQASVPVEVTQAAPAVTITGTTAGLSGESLALTCAAEGAGSTYKYSWSSTAVNGANLTFDSTTRSVVSVMLPVVTQPTNIIAMCEVTDEFGAMGQSAKAVTVSPVPAPPAPPASAASGV